MSETKDDTNAEWKDTMYLGEALKREMLELYKVEQGLDDLDDI